MSLDVAYAVLAVAKPLGWVVTTQLLDECTCTADNLLGKLNDINTLENDVVSFHWVWTSERWTAVREHTI